MSLATRCTHCGTIFRVVQDQLKISEGWVRCGRCQEVFSALEGLFDLEREAPPQRAEKPSATEIAAQGAVDFVITHHPLPIDFAGDFPSDSAEASAPPDAGGDEAEDKVYVESQRRPSGLGGLESDAVDLELDRDELAFGNASKDSPLAHDLLDRAMDHRADHNADFHVNHHTDDNTSADVEQDAAAVASSSFLGAGSAPRTRWQRPAARAGLAGLVLVLVTGLLLQVALQFRDVFAAQWPESRAGLEALCDVAGCKIEPMRRLAAVSVEASGLTQVQGADAYRLNITLHNRSGFDIAVPSVDLSLTDGAGGLVARRALSPSAFSASPELALAGSSRVLPPGAEVQLQALLASRATRITGYNVELFYP